ncbi:hypothetical protein ES703_83127 [subsurface metagenome]
MLKWLKRSRCLIPRRSRAIATKRIAIEKGAHPNFRLDTETRSRSTFSNPWPTSATLTMLRSASSSRIRKLADISRIPFRKATASHGEGPSASGNKIRKMKSIRMNARAYPHPTDAVKDPRLPDASMSGVLFSIADLDLVILPPLRLLPQP